MFEKIEIDRVRWLLGVSIVGLPGGTVLGISLRDQATHGIDIQIINLIWLTLICRSFILRIGHYSLRKPVKPQQWVCGDDGISAICRPGKSLDGYDD